MRLTRRNTIIGLATLAGGAGVIGGSGAFDQVQANRDFEVQVSGDSAALLALEPASDSQIVETEEDSTGNNDVLVFSLTNDDASGVNADAVTVFRDTFSITNNGDEAVDVSIDTGNANGVKFILTGNDLGADNYTGSDTVDIASNSALFGSGETATVDVEIDTRASAENGGYTEPDGDAYQMVITADDPDTIVQNA